MVMIPNLKVTLRAVVFSIAELVTLYGIRDRVLNVPVSKMVTSVGSGKKNPARTATNTQRED